jgi:acetyltransferase-like isoleucine patch superfamily enzyme
VVINPVAQIGENVIVNICASVYHDCVIDDGAHIAPGAHLAARVHVGRGSWVGIGSVVKEGVRIGKATVIGAGSLVLNDLPDDAVADGSPARLVRSLSHG